ncbi:MAG: restriction endonuclease subunit S [Burkholderiales bacterium]|nr:restriction endonuclease subunit S [Burkholderiales bacterium]
MRFPAYPKYKPSGVDAFPKVPEHWGAKRLKTSATYWVSNVDKLSADDELPVRLCNYTDVYYNDEITPDLSLMEATATSEEIRRFGLAVDDVVITKDSEEWSDIAIPARVAATAPDLVCGYHLAIVRPRPAALSGGFLLRAMQATAVNQQFQIAATGVTRFGLPKSAIGEAWLPLPPLAEQAAIAEFLSRETAKIDALVTKKWTLIERLKEKRTALISRTVTRGLPPDAARAAGLDPHAKLKPSGIDWLGDVPEHWEISRLRFLFRNLDHRRVPISGEDRASLDKVYPYYGASGIIDQVEDYIFDEPLILVAEDGANLLSRSTPLAFMATGKYWVNNHAHILKPVDGDIRYWVAVLQTFDYTPLISGAAQPKLTGERLGSIELPRPPKDEQRAIADYLDVETAKLDRMVSLTDAAVERLLEYRGALVTAAVTGKIDVREAAA